MGEYGVDPESMVESKSEEEIFREARLDREGLDRSQWPAQIDRAALDLQYGIAVGKTGDLHDIGGAIGAVDFHWATGEFYIEGLQAMAGEETSLASTLQGYDPDKIGKVAYRLNEFRHALSTTGQEMDIDRAIEALVEKQATRAIQRSAKRGGSEGAALRQLRDTGSVSELTLKLFSDPRIDAYAQALIDRLSDAREEDELLSLLDQPSMTTLLWDHQRRALREWGQQDQQGYVDMATATGKTVLGLAAIAYRYGRLHPADTGEEGRLPPKHDRDGPDVDHPTVLVVAGSELLLKQWRDEFDDHLDIPRSRTQPVDTETGALVELGWGDVEFRTAPSLLDEPSFHDYDLVILDEAHRYTRGSTSGRAWGDMFEQLTEESDAILAMSGSVDGGWGGDQAVKDALENHLDRCIKFSVPEARSKGVIADFDWQVHYADAAEEDQQRLAVQTRVTRDNYDATTGTLDTEALGIADADVPHPFQDYTDIRSFVQSNDGNRLREQSDSFDMFASALLARRPIRWNTSPTLDDIANLVARHAPDQKTVVLVGSYDEAAAVQECLVEDFGIDEGAVIALESARGDRHGKIQAFNERPSGVLVGPGNLLGVGVDMPDAEVAVNVARGGVNPSLVQRIGRVLRNPEGDKEALFYHVVPQPTTEDALHDVEDGAHLLREAAEYYRLGETFKQPPTFATAGDAVAATLVDLEEAGVELFERIDEAGELVDDREARKHVRHLQSVIYDARADSTVRDDPVLTSHWGGELATTDEPGGGATTEDRDRQFPERNNAYEQYRLALGPFRAGKRVATAVLDSAFEADEADDGYRVELDEEYEDTEFHAELERWTNRYREWRAACDNRDGEGEPGSLPQYKEEWPEPAETDGAMLTPDAAADIGIDYASSDPIFFPQTDDGGIYTFPLPDGRRLTVEGIVDEDTVQATSGGPSSDETDRTSEEGQAAAGAAETVANRPDQFEISLAVVEALRASSEEDVDIATVAPDVVADALSEWVTGTRLPEIDRSRTPREQVRVPLADRQRRTLELVVEESEQHTSPSEVVEAALCSALEVELDGTTPYTVPVELQTDTAVLLERRVAKSEFDDVEEFIGTIATEAVRKEFAVQADD